MTTNVPLELRYTASHEWVRDNGDGTVTVGITEHAQHALGDIVYVDTPADDRNVASGEACAVVESVKAASDVYSPLSGVIVAGNTALVDAPELVNSDPYGAGWLFKMRPQTASAAESLLNSEKYREQLVAAGE